jgi:hypothetical protein
MSIGKLSILNVGEGDLTIKFDDKNEIEKARAAKIIGDLIKQGYAIMVQTGTDDRGPLYRRAQAFDPATNEYVVFGDVNPVPIAASSVLPKSEEGVLSADKPKRGRPVGRVPATTSAIAVGRTAGGYDPVLPHKILKGVKLRDAGGIL